MEDLLPSGCLPLIILRSLKSSLVTCSHGWQFPTSRARGLRAMPEGSPSAPLQGPMGEESPQLSSPLSTGDHVKDNVDLGPDCYRQGCVEPLDGEGERPVSLVSTLSSSSSADSQSLFGSTAALPSSTATPQPSEEDIDLELSPAEGTNQSPRLRGSGGGWWRHLEACVINNQRNNNNGSAARPARAKLLHMITSPVVADTMAPNPKLTYVDRVVMEIIETERMYVRDLSSIVEDYLAHIIDMRNLPIGHEQVMALFGNIEDIYEFNSELLQCLDMCENDPVAIAHCFVDKSEYFEIYTKYCNNYPNSVATLTDFMRNKTLAKFFRDRQAALKCSLPLGSYLLKPVQRILKYHLLLQEIAKHYDPDEEGYEVIQEAIDTMTGVAWYINDMKRKHEHAVRVQEIQSLLINWKGADLTTCGELVLEGTFPVLRAKNTRTLFLFEKMLLITKKRGEHYIYKIHILCSTLMLLDNAKDPLLFSVIHFKRPKQPHTVQAKSVEEKRLWAHHIKRLILENHNTILPQKAKGATVDNSNYSGKYQYSPERTMKAECCQSDSFHLGGRNGRRRSEPAKQIIKSTNAVLKHADSEGTLLGDRSSLQPAASVRTLTACLGEPPGERPCVEDLGNSVEQLNAADSDSSHTHREVELEQEKVIEEEEEGEICKEDVLMGDDQVADFASSVLAAISCWHYRARALLSTHFTTDDQNEDAAELNAALTDEAEACRGVENNEDVSVKQTVSAQVDEQGLYHLDGVPQVEPINPLEEENSHCFESTKSFSEQETESPESLDASRETGGEEEEEEESDSSGLQVEEMSALTNSELSEEEEEVLSDNKSFLPSSVLDQAGVIAERFISSLSRRSSLVSEDQSSPLLDKEPFESLSACLDMEKQTEEMLESSSAEPQTTSKTAQSGLQPDLSEGERRSTLSKKDRLLIHKIRQYYDHAEHQDANFGIKRRESLSYIPAGLVRHLSKQLNDIPKEKVGPVHRKGLSRNRPTSWSVFDLPRLENSKNGESQSSGEAKDRSNSVTDVFTAEEEFRPSSEMLKVWDLLETEEEIQEGKQVSEEKVDNQRVEIGLDGFDVKASTPPPLKVREPETSTTADTRFVPSPTTSSPTAEWASAQDSTPCTPTALQGDDIFHPNHLPRSISFQTTIDEDQILQDMGKMKSKVFKLARQYSQRIKNNRPLVWQRSRQPANQDGTWSVAAVDEDKLIKKGKPNLRLHVNACDQDVIHEAGSPSSHQTPTGSQDTATSPHSPQSETFLWPHVQELRSKYTGRSLKTNCVCTEPDGMKASRTSHKYRSSSDLRIAPTDCCKKCLTVEDWPQQKKRSLLCRWSSLDHMLGSVPLHEVQNLQEPARTCSPRDRIQDEDGLLQDVLNATKSLSSGKSSESNLVKSLREKFQSLSTN
ncbi:pleckstrin homology domain-containing family G member 3 isoform X1 [Fundulus heteroclitus]|uniref:pleckstrin homology domain-containing family G member 3 isoform X1 n=2 Tax=Fundulus heteroclitus TaxID=8078 RepID=UPI00165BF635|nr:pleckstrin homology domain-containing family G member 3 isoform X1 [Fundulus heteroclitus]